MFVGYSTPTVYDEVVRSHPGSQVSWLIKMSVDNVVSNYVGSRHEQSFTPPSDPMLPGYLQQPTRKTIALRVESLQFLSKLAKGYFAAVK